MVRRPKAGGTERSRGEMTGGRNDESEAETKTPEGAEKAGNSLYRSDGSTCDRARDRGRFVAGDEASRFWSHVDQTGTCWVWTGRRSSDGLYGRFTDAQGREVRAHRWAYEAAHGPIPAGLTLDHLTAPDGPCAIGGLCVFPDHLEPVTNAENLRRRHARRRARQETER